MPADAKLRNPWWSKWLGLNWLYKKFGIVIFTMQHSSDYKWFIGAYRIRKEK